MSKVLFVLLLTIILSSKSTVFGNNLKPFELPCLNSLVFLVDLNGHGNFTKIQSAIDDVPDLIMSKTLIIINSGVYREKVEVGEKKTNILMLGRGYQRTIIEWNDTAHSSSGGTSDSYSFAIFASNFVAYNMSFKVKISRSQVITIVE